MNRILSEDRFAYMFFLGAADIAQLDSHCQRHLGGTFRQLAARIRKSHMVMDETYVAGLAVDSAGRIWFTAEGVRSRNRHWEVSGLTRSG